MNETFMALARRLNESWAGFVFLRVLSVLTGSRRLGGRVMFVHCVLMAMNFLKAYPLANESALIRNIRTTHPQATDGTCLIAITRAKEILFKPEFLTPAIREEIKWWARL